MKTDDSELMEYTVGRLKKSREVGRKPGECGIIEAKGRGKIRMEGAVQHHMLLRGEDKN